MRGLFSVLASVDDKLFSTLSPFLMPCYGGKEDFLKEFCQRLWVEGRLRFLRKSFGKDDFE